VVWARERQAELTRMPRLRVRTENRRFMKWVPFSEKVLTATGGEAVDNWTLNRCQQMGPASLRCRSRTKRPRQTWKK
jgi:hypothetical protein